MKIVLLINDNYFSYIAAKKFLKKYKSNISLVVFSSSLIQSKGLIYSILWVLKKTGLRHTLFKLFTYGFFKLVNMVDRVIPNMLKSSSTFLWVKRNKINYLVTSDVNSLKSFKRIKEASPELIISISMNQIIKKEILNLPQKRCINVHCAPLPKYAGMSPYVWALANNESHSAATIHYMDEGLDTGDVIEQRKISILKDDTSFSLFHRSCMIASDLLLTVIEKIEVDHVKSYPQDLSQKSYFSWPTKKCIKNLKNNGYSLAKIKDFYMAILYQESRL